ncbi:MAG: putative 2OG-Fe(II) oxygenase, partial [Hyphomicrobium sp.]|nr:putative 2OG-Fe(II) oxygenase [Hyphomicrobium sp.]
GAAMRWDISADRNKRGLIVELARKAVALRPDDARQWELFAHSLLLMERDDEAVAALTDAVARLPAVPKLPLMLADIHHRRGHGDLFDRVMRQVPEIPADDLATTLYRLELLMKAAAASDAVRIAREILARDPTHDAAMERLAYTLKGSPEIMIPICRAALDRKAGHVLARYELAAAYARLGRSDQARNLIDLDRFVLDRFVTVTDLVASGEYAAPGAFEGALSDEIARNPTLQPDPAGKATRGGLQTAADLAFTSEGAVGALTDLLRSAVDAFVAGLPDRADDPFIAARPESAAIHAWAVVYPSEGFQKSHIHYSGWLSGVYYVTAPKLSRGDDARAGCLALGSLDLPEGREPPWGVRDIRPAPGRLVLFPSFVPHATLPTKSPEPRICVAFDVVPCSPQASR